MMPLLAACETLYGQGFSIDTSTQVMLLKPGVLIRTDMQQNAHGFCLLYSTVIHPVTLLLLSVYVAYADELVVTLPVSCEHTNDISQATAVLLHAYFEATLTASRSTSVDPIAHVTFKI
jgi:hypothetical protein